MNASFAGLLCDRLVETLLPGGPREGEPVSRGADMNYSWALVCAAADLEEAVSFPAQMIRG